VKSFLRHAGDIAAISQIRSAAWLQFDGAHRDVLVL